MKNYVDSVISSKISEKLSSVSSRISEISASTGLNFAQTLKKASEVTIEEETSVTYNEKYAQLLASPVKSTESTVSSSSSSSNLSVSNTAYDDIIISASEKYNISAALIKAIVRGESAFNSNAVSKVGAMGLMQLMPGTAEGLGVTDAFDPEQNIDGGSRYIASMLSRFNGDIKLALAAYNWGPGAVSSRGITDSSDEEQWSKVPSSVRNYVERILSYAENYN